MNKDIRWQQRFQNFQKAFNYLSDALKIEDPSDAERAGIIQFYEVAFELARKTLTAKSQELRANSFQL